MHPSLARRAATVALALAVAAATVVAAAATAAARMYFVPGERTVELTGHGYGHGIGMSQHGAQGAALQGRGYRQILGFYYPNTRVGTVSGNIRVLITADTTSDVKVSPRSGLAVRELGSGRTWTLPTNLGAIRWRLLHSPTRVQYSTGSGYTSWKGLTGDAEFFAPGPIRLWVPGGGGEVGRDYRGALRMVTRSGGADTVNVLPLEQYLRGVVAAEMPASWHPEALKAQSVAARTYAQRDRVAHFSRYYHTCDTTSCQVYRGVAGEHANTDAAIAATAREVLYYGGTVALTMFSASNGGYSVDGGTPYLVARPDPYDGWSGNSVHTWKVDLPASAIQRAYPALGTLIGIDVIARDGNGQWGGRVETAVLDGTKGDVRVSGTDLRWKFGLRSTWFTPRSTAIDRRWTRLGRDASPVGGTYGAEFFAAGGAVQVFERGRIFWSSSTGAHEVYGRILDRYRALGGVGSTLRFPSTGEVAGAVPGSRLNRFQGGRIYWSRATGAHEVYGAILRRYVDLGAESSKLRLPTRGEYDVSGGRATDFQGGRIVWHRATGTTTVHYS